MDPCGLLLGIHEAWWGLRAKPKELEAVSQKRLRSLVDRAYRNVPFYSRVFHARNMSPDQIRNIDDLSKLPVITNGDVVDNWPQFVDQEFKVERCVCNKTSGSKGQPTAFLHEPHAFYRLMGISLRGQINGGLRLTHRVALVRPTLFETPTLFSHNFYNLLSSMRRVKYWSTSDGTRETLRGIQKFRPDVLKTYPHFLKLAMSGNENLECPLVFTDSEILEAETRKRVEESCRCRIVDLYDSVEFPSIAWQCTESSLYHIDADAVVVEALKLHSDMPADFGERSRIVVTGLIGHAMPLIRYDIGDVGILTDEACGCGVRLPLMKSIEGRVVDCLTLPSGRVISPYILIKWVSAHSIGIKQYQIIQEEKNRFLVRAVLDSRVGKETLTKLTASLRELIAEPVIIESRRETAIPTAPSGKYRVVMSKVS